ncbi:MAG: hypothetical protein ACRCU1_18955 [Alsobacter sp.]
MATARVDITREIEETYPLLMRFAVSEAQAISLGYDGLEAFVAAVEASTIQLQVPALSIAISAAIATQLQAGIDAQVSLTFALPTTITDTAQSRIYLAIFEPGSVTSERVLCHGSITINARLTA